MHGWINIKIYNDPDISFCDKNVKYMLMVSNIKTLGIV